MKDMSKININDVDYYFEDEDEIEETSHENRASRRHKTRTRRKIEYLLERRKLKEMLYTEESYWGD